jgi:hypothetical protein
MEESLKMPGTLGCIFTALFLDRSWTNAGLARLIVAHFERIDLDDLLTCIEMERNKRRKA